MSIKFFKEIKEDEEIGGKGASLVKMYQNKYNIPNGYIITADTFNEFLKENNIKETIQELINECNINDERDIEEKSNQILKNISQYDISNKTRQEIINKFEELDCKYVAVRSSATSEDGKNNAWAGQLETFLNIDKTKIVESVKKCWSSLFSPRALFYRIKNNDKSDIAVAVVVQKMIQSEISGVAFSVNPTTNNPNEIIIETVLGLGEAIVSGKVTPNTYIVDKQTDSIKTKEVKNQKIKLIQTEEGTKWSAIKSKDVDKINDEKILELSKVIKEIEIFYGFPVDIEWGIENETIYILQCRPITTIKSEKIAEEIKKRGNWKFYVTRKFNWFVENTEIYASLEKYQKELLGFEVATQNYLCLNGDEYALDTDFEILCNKLDYYFERDINFFEKFANTEFKLVDEIKEYLEYLKRKDLGNLNFEKLYEEMKKFNDIYIKSFIPGMTRPEEYLIYKLEKELTENNFSKDDIKGIFSKISTCPNYYPLSYSEEPLDLLKIALKVKNGNDIEQLVNEHIEKYSWIKGPVEFEDTAFTKQDYIERLDNLANTNIEDKIKNINDVRESNDIEYKKILERYQFTSREKKLIKAIRDFIFLRTYTTEYSDHLFYVGRHTILKEISNRISLNNQDLIMLDDKEILSILKNQGEISHEIQTILENRKKGFAMIWLNGNIQTIFGDKSIEIQDDIAKVYKISEEKEDISNAKVISGSIANRGKVKGIARVLNTYKDIYKVKKGDIIVATMTTPDYVSAMEKAAGFITDEGGITCHAAILSREFNVPCIVGTINGTKQINDGQMIELDGYNGKVYILN